MFGLYNVNIYFFYLFKNIKFILELCFFWKLRENFSLIIIIFFIIYYKKGLFYIFGSLIKVLVKMFFLFDMDMGSFDYFLVILLELLFLEW